MMMNTYVMIFCVVLLLLCIYVLISIYRLYRSIVAQDTKIQLNKNLLKLGKISLEHVNEENLRQSDRKVELAIRKGRGIDNFEHEVRPMLEFVIDSTARIIDSDISESERHQLSLSITREVKKLSNLVENVLLMARIDSHRIEYCIENIRVADLIRGVYEGFCIQDGSQASSGEDRCRLSIVEGRPSLSISADILYMTRAIRELVKNAYSFSQKGDIFIGWSYHLGTNEVEIFVEDNGIGISLENQSSVFEVFCKEHETTGMGIGLSIAKELVENMGGKIVLVSHPGIGTRVSVLFQMVED